MGVRREFLMVGGPLHAEVQLIDQSPGDVVVTTDVADQYPTVWTNIPTASNYVQRTVAHVANRTGEAFKLTVYVWEGVQGIDEAQMLLGDAVMHRHFVEHGAPAATPTNGVAQRSALIVPDRRD